MSRNQLTVQFREPSYFEYLLYDLENFSRKAEREQLAIAWSFLTRTLPEDLTVSEVQAIIQEFRKTINRDNVIPFRKGFDGGIDN